MEFDEQQKKNEEQFTETLKAMRPDIFVLMDILDKTKVNPFVLWKVVYHLKNISDTTKYGNVVIEIENGVIRFIRSQSADKINEPLILEKLPNTISGL
jgi:hypothetical protein